MGIADFNFKGIDSVKAKVESLKIGVNKDQTQINIDSVDQSTRFHYHTSIGLSPDVILRLPSQELGDYLKQQTWLQLKAIHQDSPDQLAKLMATYNVVALTTATTALVVRASIPMITEEPSSSASSESSSSTSIESLTPISSGAFINQLPKTIESDIEIKPIKPTQS